jgi:hypothetical protein
MSHAHLKYGILAGNQQINACIYKCLEVFCDEDARKFVKKFRNDSPIQSTHTFRELLVGAYLMNLGLNAKYEKNIQGKTPDWSVWTIEWDLVAIIEQMTFNQSRELKDEITTTLKSGQIWTGWIPPNVDRLFQKLQEKSEKYEPIAASLRIPYIVAIFSDFMSSIDQEELQEVLFKVHDGGIFRRFKELAGILFFEESAANYEFTYLQNPFAPQAIFLANRT